MAYDKSPYQQDRDRDDGVVAAVPGKRTLTAALPARAAPDGPAAAVPATDAPAHTTARDPFAVHLADVSTAPIQRKETDADHEPPGVAKVKAMVAAHQASPIEVAAYLKTAPGERAAVLAYLHRTFGAGFAQSVVKQLDAAPDHVAGPVAAEVDGVATGAIKSKQDDDDGIEMTATEKKTKASISGGAAHVTHTKTDTTTSGDDKTVDARSTDVSVGTKGGAVERVHTREESVGEDAATKVTHGYGGSVGPGGVAAHGKVETEAKLGDHKHTKALEGSASVGLDGKVNAEAARTIRTEDQAGSHEAKVSGAIHGANLELGVANKDTHKAAVPGGADTGRSSDVKVRAGLDGVGADTNHAIAHANGSKTSGGAGFDVGSEGATGHANVAHETASGHKVSGGVDITKDSVSGHAGYSVMSKGGSAATVSVSGGTKVHANEPVAVGDHFEVAYVRTTTAAGSAGGSTSGGGVGISGSAGVSDASFESGTRSFKTKAEAEAFQKHAADKISSSMFDPGTLAGAMQIPVGETRGHGDASTVSASGALSFEGASIGGGGHSTSGHEVDIRRVSPTEFDVTRTASGEHGAEIAISAGLSNTKSRSKSEFWSVTWRFDVSTKDGQAAFEKYAKDGLPPAKHGTKISVEHGNHADTKDNIKIPVLGTAEWKEETDEKHRIDAKGTHDQYSGAQVHDQDPGWVAKHLGDKAEHSRAELTARMENGKEAGYTASVHVSGESGEYNRTELAKMSLDPAGHGPAKASGDWTLSADIDKKTIHELEQNVSAFRGAKTEEDKMRVLTGLVAAHSQMLGGKAAFDVELKGDKNFPGKAGHDKIEATIKELTHLITEHPEQGAAVVSRAQHEIDELTARRTNVANHEKYTDLPDGLRAQQLQLIDDEIANLSAVRHRALQESVKNSPGESIEKIRAREADPHAFGKLSPEDKQLAEIRDQIADYDAKIAQVFKDNSEMYEAVHKGLRSASPGPGFGPAQAAAHRADAKDADRLAAKPTIEAIRMLVFTSTGLNRLTQANVLLALLKANHQTIEEVWKALFEAGMQLRPLTTAAGRKGHEAFWDQFSSGDS
jgi:hypothetical protein